MSEDILKRLDSKLIDLVGGTEEAKARLAEIDAKYGDKLSEQEKRIKALDDTIVLQKEHVEKLEEEFTKKRYGGIEPDALQNAIPDQYRRHIAFAEAQSKNADLDKLSPSMRKYVGSDPVLRTATAAWFATAMNQKLAALRGDQIAAQRAFDANQKLTAALGGVEKAALAEGTDNIGGYLVPQVTEAMIGRLIGDNGVVRRSGPTIIQMTTNIHELPQLASNFTAYISAEAVTITDSAGATPIGSVNLTAQKFVGLATVSLELLEDNIVNLSDFILTHIAERIARLEDTQILEATTGLKSVAGVVTQAGGTTTLNMSLMVKTVYAAEEAAAREGACWWMHPWVMRDAVQLTTGSAGSPWFGQTWNNQLFQQNILGYPVFPTAAIGRAGGASTDETTVYFGNPKGLVFGDRSGTRFDVDPYGLFTGAQVRLRVIKRTGLAVWVPSQFVRLTAIKVAT